MRLVEYQERKKDKQYPYAVRFLATPETKPYFNDFASLIGKHGCRYSIEEKSWLVTQEVMAALWELDQKLFTPRTEAHKEESVYVVSTPVPTSSEQSLSGAESMGSMMKLQPYPYQKDIIKFCVDAKTALIVSPCGSGKSPSLIGCYLEARKAGIIKGPGLIVVKASLKVQWYSEVMKFSDLKPVIIKTSRQVTPLYAKAEKLKRDENTIEMAYEIEAQADEILAKQFEGADLFILNYETLNDENIRRVLHKIKPQFIACDEIQYVKSDKAKRSKSLYDISNSAIVRIGATATPVQRDPLDIFGIFKFIRPELFPKKSQFERFYLRYGGFGRVIGAKNEEDLNKTISPYMIIKTKEEVAKQLPSLVVSQRYCTFEPKQQEVNDRLMKELDDLHEQEKQYLGAFVGNPAMIERAKRENPEIGKLEAGIVMRQTFAQELADSELLLQSSESEAAKNYTTKVKRDNKLELLMDILEENWEEDPQKKICIFSKYRRMQDIITARIEELGNKKTSIFYGTQIAYVNGSLSPEQRYVEVYQKFQGENSTARLLLCSDAGAEGLNLSECPLLIEYDLAESYAIQTQRHGRIERADSKARHVQVIQLITENSWDEIQYKIVSKKEAYDATIIHGE